MSAIISVIIPTNKPYKYLRECLASIDKQTISSALLEVLVIINGCSKDSYEETCKQFNKHKKYDNFRFIYEKNSGVSNARNIGLDHALGIYVAFIDDDDLISRNYLEQLYVHAEPNQIVVSNLRCFEDNIDNYYYDYLSKAFLRLQGETYTIISYRSFLSVCCGKLIPMEMIGHYRFNKEIHFGEDGLFMATLSYQIKNIEISDEDCIYYRRITDNSLSRAKKDTCYIYQQRLKLIFNYLTLWLKHPTQINFLFICSRILAVSLHLVKKT